MAFVSTADERYLGGSLSYTAGEYDAPARLNEVLVLAEGETGYGALVYQNFTRDVDTYGLGFLSPGRYEVTVSDRIWDFSTFDTASVSSFEILNSFGGVVETSLYRDTLDFEVETEATYYLRITGSFFGLSQYAADYERLGDFVAPGDVFSPVSFTLLPSQVNLTLTGSGANNGTGNALSNILLGNDAGNILDGLGGDDRLEGRGGADFLFGGQGADWMEGGTEDDTYSVDNVGDIVVERVGEGFDFVLSGLSYRLGTYVEGLELVGAAHLRGVGNDGANSLTGNSGNNQIFGLAGNDTLEGAGGNDRLDGGTGVDLMIGGIGNDIYVVDAKGDRVVELAGNGTDYVFSRINYALPAEVEHLALLGTGALNGAGNAVANALRGNAGANVLVGLGGNDVIYGGGGSDRLFGGAGRDISFGQAGADVFVFRSAGEAGIAAGRDVIRDLQQGVDRIDLSNIDANTRTLGNQAFAFIGAEDFSRVGGELRADGGLVHGDLNGDGRADFEVAVRGGVSISSGDFML